MNDTTHIVTVTAENFQQQVLDRSSKQLVLADFWASWCGPCQSLIPVLEKLAQEYAGKFLLAKINSDEQQALAQHFQVRSLPTVKFFKDGAMVDEFMGAQPEPVIREMLDRHIDKESDRVWHQARQLIAAGQEEQGLELLLAAHREDPENSRITIDLAEFYLNRKELDKATEMLATLSAEDRAKPEAAALLIRTRLVADTENAPPEAALEETLQANPRASQALYLLSLHKACAEDYAAAMELLLRLLKQDPGYNDGIAKKTLIDLFALLGNEGELVNTYRRKLASLLH